MYSCYSIYSSLLLNSPGCNLCIFQLENYAKTEEAKVEELIKAVADSGARVIVSGAAVGEMALHFCERYKYIPSQLSSYFFFFIFLSFMLNSWPKVLTDKILV